MTDTTPHPPDGLGPSPDRATGPAGSPAAGIDRVRFPLVRWALAPRTTWQARRLTAEFGPGMDARTAWVMARLAQYPEEHVHAMRHLNGDENAD
ncbi:hypothetical protein [Streptomyces cyaneofuscatus]|uniref:hypothetical protein n=1 Tax=Streptomyces cyaneofuscatus TaxID=66883 RepID=UPI00365B7B8F